MLPCSLQLDLKPHQAATNQLETELIFKAFVIQLDIRTNTPDSKTQPNRGVFFRADPAELDRLRIPNSQPVQKTDCTKTVDLGLSERLSGYRLPGQSGRRGKYPVEIPTTDSQLQTATPKSHNQPRLSKVQSSQATRVIALHPRFLFFSKGDSWLDHLGRSHPNHTRGRLMYHDPE